MKTRSKSGKPARGAKKSKSPRTSRPRVNATFVDKVRHNIIFTGLNPSIVKRHGSKFAEKHYKAGDIIFDEQSRGRELYLICRGRVKIQKVTKFGVESLLAVLHEGDFFGELSVIDGFPRSARAEAMDECMLAAIGPDAFQSLVRKDPQFTLNLLTNLAVRLRSMDQTFVQEIERNASSSRSKVDRLNQLIEASKIVNSAIDIDKLLGLILNVATKSIAADRGTIYLVDEANNELWSKVAQGNNMVEIRLSIGKGLAGYVAKTGETVNITDAYKDPRFNPEIDRKSGYKTHNVLCMPMRNKDGHIVGVFQFLNRREGPFTHDDEGFIDALSVHASIAFENARMAREMVQSERLSAVGKMASTIIHDIKNPMGTLRMYAQVIMKKSGNAEASELAEEMIRQVDRFVNMTQEILDFSRGISEIHLEDVNVEEAVEGALSFVEKDLSKKNITVVRELGYTGETVMDLEKMVRVFYNLAGNAADAMKDGGTLIVATRLDGSDLVLEFRDSGEGIPEEIRARILEPFFTHGKKHGTGLGLAIVKKVVDDHKGRLEVESEVGKGTTMRIVMPVKQ